MGSYEENLFVFSNDKTPLYKYMYECFNLRQIFSPDPLPLDLYTE